MSWWSSAALLTGVTLHRGGEVHGLHFPFLYGTLISSQIKAAHLRERISNIASDNKVMYLVFLLTGTPSRPENPGTPIGPCVSKQPRVLYNYVIWSNVCSFSFNVNVNVTLSPFGPDGPFSPPWPFSPLGPGCPMPPRGPSAPGRPTSPRGPGRPWNKRGGIITTIYSHCWEISCLIGESLGYRDVKYVDQNF